MKQRCNFANILLFSLHSFNILNKSTKKRNQRQILARKGKRIIILINNNNKNISKQETHIHTLSTRPHDQAQLAFMIKRKIKQRTIKYISTKASREFRRTHTIILQRPPQKGCEGRVATGGVDSADNTGSKNGGVVVVLFQDKKNTRVVNNNVSVRKN